MGEGSRAVCSSLSRNLRVRRILRDGEGLPRRRPASRQTLGPGSKTFVSLRARAAKRGERAAMLARRNDLQVSLQQTP